MGAAPVTFDTDGQRIAANQGKTYMATVSPCFFTVRYTILSVFVQNFNDLN